MKQAVNGSAGNLSGSGWSEAAAEGLLFDPQKEGAARSRQNQRWNGMNQPIKKKQWPMKNLFCLGILFTLLAASGCRKDCVDPADPECSNYDPCTGYVAADAGFRMLKIPIATLGWDCDGEEPRDLEFETDTIFAGGPVYFRADQEQAAGLSYEWKIGADARTWTTREFELRFGQNAVGDIPVTLMVEKANPLACGGTAYTRDTLTKNLHVKRIPDDIYTGGTWSPIFGRWEGRNTDDPTSIFQVEVHPDWSLTGLLEGCTVKIPQVDIGINFMYIKARTNTSCSRLCGVGTVSEDRREFYLTYSYNDSAGKRVYRKFIGRRVE
jgi:hypothetical protein